MTDWWHALKKGDHRIFGFLQIDLQGSSRRIGPDSDLMELKATLHDRVEEQAVGHHLMKLSWAGDGGTFGLLIEDQFSYANLAQCALEMLNAVIHLNNERPSADQLIVRISCHAGPGVFYPDGSLLHSEELNAFVKSERQIGTANEVVLTETVHSQIKTQDLLGLFQPVTTWNYELKNAPKSQRLYTSSRYLSSLHSFDNLTHAEMIGLISSVFAKKQSTIKSGSHIGGFQADILIEEPTATAGPIKTIVHCRAYKRLLTAVDVRALDWRLQELADRHAYRIILVSLRGFSEDAEREAKSAGINLRIISDVATAN